MASALTVMWNASCSYMAAETTFAVTALPERSLFNSLIKYCILKESE